MSDINVALSTTKFVLTSPELSRAEIPVCIAEVGLGMLGFLPYEAEREENQLSQICLRMSKVVHIDVEKQWVFIGEDPQILESSLIDYTEERKTPYTDGFFKRWQQLHILYMEFQLFNALKKEHRFVISGLWDRDHWSQKEIITQPKISIFPG